MKLSLQNTQHVYGDRKQAFLQTSYAITKEVSALNCLIFFYII